MRLRLLSGLLGGTAVVATVAAQLLAQHPFDITSYELHLRIDPSTETISGVATVRFCSRDSALQSIELDLSSALTVSGVVGNSAGFVHANDRLTVQLDHALAPGEHAAVAVYYAGKPRNVGGLGMVFARAANAPSVHTISCPYHAYLWMPCRDYPGDKADSVRMVVTVPSSMVVASNGRPLAQEPHGDGTTTFTWLESYPIATYLICLTAGKYTVLNDAYTSVSGKVVPLQYFVYPSDVAKAQEDFAVVPRAMAAFEHWFGEYPFADEKYGMAECQMIFGGMEHQTMTTIHPNYITGQHTYDDVFVHELAHMWWGDCVTVENWHHCWLNEGFASYAEALYHEYYSGKAAYHAHMNTSLNALQYKEPVYRHDLSNAMGIFDAVVYNKGAWILHMLRGMVGDSAFKEILRLYRQRHEYGNATTEDFCRVCEEVAGTSLDWFFQEWVYDRWHPEYFYGYRVTDKGVGYSPRYAVKMFIDQEQAIGPLFHMPLLINVRAPAGYEWILLPRVEERYLTLSWETEVRPDTILLDPDGWVLKEAKSTTRPAIGCVAATVVHDSGNNDGRADPGEMVQLSLLLDNRGVDAEDVQIVLSCPDPAIALRQDTARVSFLEHREQKAVGPFEFAVSDTATARRVAFVARMGAAGGYAACDTFTVGVGRAPLLLVDDDGGASYEGYFLSPLAELGTYVDYWNSAQQGPPKVADLSSYDTVIWFTGDDDSTTLTSVEQAALADYLAKGRNLLLTGQNIASDLMARRSAPDSAFCADLLHIGLVQPSTSDYLAMGVAGDPIAPGLVINLRGQYGAGNQTAPDVVTPLAPGVVMLKYLPSQGGAAVHGQDARTGAKLVYLAFGFEGIGGPSKTTATQLLQKILAWFALPSGVHPDRPSALLPESFRLLPPHPNPFNSSVVVLVELPAKARLRLTVVNAAGQVTRVLVDEQRAPGRYRERWDGCDAQGNPVASGVYYLQAEAGNMRDSSKVVLLR
ncbi:MAG: M1 family aminopeptidase [bacterium]|jgi:hypothetical protein|nr:hypothetical protein [candidate division KSB1 bacterium]MDH7560255.1 M1 family aminopeptidase [bacterium]